MRSPRVSVILLTYNHERYISEAIESVLVQRVGGGIELLISEDCSTDSTRDIVRGYAARHPDRIRLFLSDRNVNTNEVTARALSQVRGRYAAFLDGDDYWTSAEKLEKQAAFLDANQACALCFHNVDIVDETRGGVRSLFLPEGCAPVTGLRELLQGNYIPGCAPMIRSEALVPLPAWFLDSVWGDWPLYIIAAQRGWIGYLDEVLGVYRRHAGGYWSGRSAADQLEGLVAFAAQLEQVLDRDWLEQIRRRRLDWLRELSVQRAVEARS